MITYAPGMDAKLTDPNWRAAQRAATFAQQTPRQQAMSQLSTVPGARSLSNPLGPMQQLSAYGPSAFLGAGPRPTSMPLGPMQQRFTNGPVAPYVPTASAALFPPVAAGAALLGLGALGWKYGAPKQGMSPDNYTYDQMGNITGITGITDNKTMQGMTSQAMPVPPAAEPMGYTGDVGMMARYPVPRVSPQYSPELAARVAQHRAMLNDAAITDQLNRESQIRETVVPMEYPMNPTYNPDDYVAY